MKKELQERLDALGNSIDNNGNRYFIDEKDNFKLYLVRAGNPNKIAIGHIVIGDNNLLYHKYEDEKNIFQLTNA